MENKKNPNKENVKNKNQFLNDLIEKVKKFLSVKRNRIVSIIALAVLAILILCLIFLKPGSGKFALNEAYDVYPEEVRELYSNFVSVSCTGDIHFDIAVDSGKVDIENIKKTDLLNYMFSNLDKNGLLNDNLNDNVIKNAEKQLFDKKLNLTEDIKSFPYGDYVYTVSSGKVTREKHECKANETEYVTHLYGYFWNDDKLSIDINVGYLKDGMLYSYDNKELGKYDGDVTKLSELMAPASYYRASYTRYDKNKYKLTDIEWKHKS